MLANHKSVFRRKRNINTIQIKESINLQKHRSKDINMMFKLDSIGGICLLLTASAAAVAASADDTTNTSGGCKTQYLDPCGKQDWCLDVATGKWTKNGDVYDETVCTGGPTTAGSTPDTGTGTWTAHALDFEGLPRSYLTYAPKGEASYAAGNYTGVMLFLHGSGGSSNVHRFFDVTTYADKYGFVGVVPDGSPFENDQSAEKDEKGAEKDATKTADGACEYYLFQGQCYQVCGDGKKPIVDMSWCEGKTEWGQEKSKEEETIDAAVEPKDGCEYYLYFGKCYEYCGDDTQKPIVNNMLCEGKVDLQYGKSGGNRKLQGTFKWNLDDSEGPNEVSFLKHIVAKESEVHLIDSKAPKIAIGFSNGAGMVILLGCQTGGDLWVACTAMPIDMDAADFPSTCASVKGGASKDGKLLRQRYLETTTFKTSWNAVGENDYFIDSLKPTPVEGLINQFEARHERSECDAEDWTEMRGDDFTCFHYPNCAEVGELCVYDDIGHAIKPSMTENAWQYLTSTSVESVDTTKKSFQPALNQNLESEEESEVASAAAASYGSVHKIFFAVFCGLFT